MYEQRRPAQFMSHTPPSSINSDDEDLKLDTFERGALVDAEAAIRDMKRARRRSYVIEIVVLDQECKVNLKYLYRVRKRGSPESSFQIR